MELKWRILLPTVPIILASKQLKIFSKQGAYLKLI
jgi:hypothetical protein